MSDNINRPNDQIEEKMKKKNEQIMKCFLLCFVFRFIGIMSLWTSNWCDCDTEMCQHNQHTYKNEFFCSSLFTQKRSNHNQHKNKHSTNIASIGMCLVYSTKVLFLFLRFVSVCVFFFVYFSALTAPLFQCGWMLPLACYRFDVVLFDIWISAPFSFFLHPCGHPRNLRNDGNMQYDTNAWRKEIDRDTLVPLVSIPFFYFQAKQNCFLCSKIHVLLGFRHYLLWLLLSAIYKAAVCRTW